MTTEEQKNRDVLAQLNSTTIDIEWAERREVDGGTEIKLHELLNEVNPAIYAQYKEKLDYLENTNGLSAHV